MESYTQDSQDSTLRFLAKGKRGRVFLTEREGTTVLIKKKNPASSVDTIAREARYTQVLNSYGIGPCFIAYEGGALIREFIDGEEFRHWLPAASPHATMTVLLRVLSQCFTMDLLGIEKAEMTRPWKHIIVRSNAHAGSRLEPVLIDFERCREVDTPKNVTQFLQFLTSTALTRQLAEKGIRINRQKLLSLAKKYKPLLKNINLCLCSPPTSSVPPSSSSRTHRATPLSVSSPTPSRSPPSPPLSPPQSPRLSPLLSPQLPPPLQTPTDDTIKLAACWKKIYELISGAGPRGEASAFQQRVFTLLARVPAGKVTSYGALARALTTSPRAIGQALRVNQDAPRVPCHRVVMRDGRIGGYRGARRGEALVQKVAFLLAEGVRFAAGRVAPEDIITSLPSR